MFDFDENRYFDKPCERHMLPKPEKPRYTISEEIERTYRLMRDTIDKLLKFEERCKKDFDDLSRNVTSDNVIFKTTMREAWAAFIQEVKNEVNLFEGNIDSAVALFQKAMETDYANLSADVMNQIRMNLEEYNSRLTAFETAYTQAFNEYKNGVNATVSDAVLHMKTNLNTTLENLLYEMKDAGQLIGVIESEVFVTPQMFGASGNGIVDDTTAIQLAIDSGKPVVFPKGTYRTTAPIYIRNECTGFDAENATINYEGSLFAFVITDVWRKTIKFGIVNAPYGGCVQLYADSSATSVAYIDMYFVKFTANENNACIQGVVSASSAFANEIRIHNGQLAKGKYGVEVINRAGSVNSSRVNNWKFYNVGLEGVDTGIFLNAETNRIERFMFVGLRYAVGEGTNTFLRTQGECYFLNWYGADKILFDTDNYFVLSNETARAYFYGNIFDSEANTFETLTFDYGEWFPNGRDSLTPTKTYSSSSNWDNIRKHGVFYVNTFSGSGGTNVPPISGMGFLNVYTSGDKITQVVMSSAGICIRTFNGEAWGAWKTATLS